MATIVKLPESTIKLIAAGEVISRPVNIVKELLENSLDAGCDNVRILIEQGGVKSIEVIDNGHGIARADAKSLCLRHTTSKLKTADDLTRMSTFGFRGEALASVSAMADLVVKTFNKNSDKQGWQATYKNGELTEKPADCFKAPGTHLKVTNLFAQTIQRKEAMTTSFPEEKRSIIDLITRYAIHHRDKVTFTLKESNSPDLICQLAPLDIGPCIGSFYGSDMESNLIELNIKAEDVFKVEAHIVLSYKKATTTNNHHNLNFILFVNSRLVEYADLKREVDAQLQEHLSPKLHIFLAYISLNVPACDVDVNTHPSKETVALHYQPEIIALLTKAMNAKLKESLAHRDISTNTSFSQKIFPFDSQSTVGSPVSSQGSQRLRLLVPSLYSGSQTSRMSSSTPSRRPHDLIHTDSSQQTLNHFINEERRIKREVRLQSIRQLKLIVAKDKTKDDCKTIKNSVFVGLFDHERALIQHETKLYAINLKAYLKEQYYQFYLFDFANFPPIEVLPPGNKIRPLIETYLDDIHKHEADYYGKLKFTDFESVINELMKHSDMFEDYLTLKISYDEILTLPCIIPEEVPNLAFLGRLLVQLANEVDYTVEQTCFHQLGRIMADFYSEPPVNLKDKDVHKQYHDLVETKLFVAIKNYLIVPEWLMQKQNICQISDTKDLYKVFERC